MRLILFDRLADSRSQFYPLVLSRPIWELRCGITSLAEKLIAKTGAMETACFVPPYMADAYREQSQWQVNDPASLKGDDLLLLNPRLKADDFDIESVGSALISFNESGDCLFVRIPKEKLDHLNTESIDALIESAREALPAADKSPATWDYTWELVLANADQITSDFAAAGRSGIHSDSIEDPFVVRGNKDDVYIGAGTCIHPMVVIDAEHGPVFIDEEVEIHPFSRVEGPCYIGKKSILLGAKCREGNSIGPVCRIGGEVEESIIQGYSNKYHDGFLGHAYVGEWVNLGALTTNSDLKNDYSNVSVTLDGRTPIDTGSTKVGALIGDHTKTSIGTLFNTGAYVGAMAVIAATGKPLPKFIPSFAWFLEGVVTKGFGKKKLFETAATVVSRRGREWSAAQVSMWEEIFKITASPRLEAVKQGRRAMRAKYS
jgi:UDP-N-acetylglucosamine diphosphorylase/glucosamine-1-phosphate N-acetyltransferase